MAIVSANVTTKAVFIKQKTEGRTYYRRAPFNIEIRDYPNDTRGRQSYLAFAMGHVPGRALDWDDSDGERYDAIELWDEYPASWPKIGRTD